jgi:methyl-accepting chemotaxis protein
MSATPLPSGGELVRGLVVRTSVFVVAAIGVISLYLAGLLQLSTPQWQAFAEIVAVTLAVIFPAMVLAHARVFRTLKRCLDRRAAGTASREDLRAGFAVVSDFPRYWFAWGVAWWAFGGTLVAGLMWLRLDDFGAFEAGVFVAATVSAAFVTDLYYYHAMKRALEPVRLALAADLGDPDERAPLVRRVSVRTKLLVAMTSLILVTSVYAGFLAHARSERSIEALALAGQHRLLDALARGELTLEAARVEAARYGVADTIALVDAGGAAVLDGDATALAPGDLAHLRRASLARGDSLGLSSAACFAWRRWPANGGFVVAVSRRATLRAAAPGALDEFAGLVLFASAVAVGAAALLANDVSRGSRALRRQAARVAAGDLGGGDVFESEDDLGDLARAFEGMRASLAAAVRRVAESADRMQGAAGEIASAAASVAAVSVDQVAGLEHASASMGAIDAQVADISRSAERLSLSMQEVSGTVCELDATGTGLHQSASALADSVEEVSRSIEEMARSIGQVARSADELSGAADDASTSTGQSARAVREVDANAGELARLSGRVVELAERGRDRVCETIAGMQAIHEATASALEVIRDLDGRAIAIGSVVGVIDDVADETNLLALNAAIIAAQAGERGRAFSVVADEIKALADRVLESTREIGGLIRSVQDQAGRATSAVSRGAERVARGVELAGEAGRALEEITLAARESGERTEEIVGSLREQSASTDHVASVVASVRAGSEQIRSAILQQGRSTASLRTSSRGVAGVSERVRATSEEQVQSAAHIKHGVQEVQDAVGRIDAALRDQSSACREATTLLGQVAARTRANDDSVRRLEAAMHGLRQQAEALREELRRFAV